MTVPTPSADAASGALLDRAPVGAKPPWMRWFCAADECYWDGADTTCWVCGNPGVAASAPRVTSQHGFDDHAD